MMAGVLTATLDLDAIEPSEILSDHARACANERCGGRRLGKPDWTRALSLVCQSSSVWRPKVEKHPSTVHSFKARIASKMGCVDHLARRRSPHGIGLYSQVSG